MLKKTITFNDLDGNPITEDFFFNFSEAELIELEVSEKQGLSELLKEIVATEDRNLLITHFKRIILLSYGEKSPDGRRFIKSPELREAFSQTDAYTKLFLELATNANAASEFINGIVPKNLDILNLPNAVPEPVETIEPVTENEVLVANTGIDYSKMTKKELLAFLEGQK